MDKMLSFSFYFTIYTLFSLHISLHEWIQWHSLKFFILVVTYEPFFTLVEIIKWKQKENSISHIQIQWNSHYSLIFYIHYYQFNDLFDFCFSLVRYSFCFYPCIISNRLIIDAAYPQLQHTNLITFRYLRRKYGMYV